MANPTLHHHRLHDRRTHVLPRSDSHGRHPRRGILRRLRVAEGLREAGVDTAESEDAGEVTGPLNQMRGNLGASALGWANLPRLLTALFGGGGPCEIERFPVGASQVVDPVPSVGSDRKAGGANLRVILPWQEG